MPHIVVAGSENDQRVAVMDFAGPTGHVDPGFASGTRVAIDGTNVAVGAVLSGMVGVIDASTPSSPTLLGAVDAAIDGTGAIAIKGSFIAVGEYVSNHGARVKFIDISTPSTPTVAGTAITTLTNVTVPNPGMPADTSAAVGSIAFITPSVVAVSGPSDPIVVIVDFTTPATPRITTFNPVISGGIALDGDADAHRIVAGNTSAWDEKLFDATSHAQIGTTADTTLAGIASIALAMPLAFAGSQTDAQVARVDFATATPVVTHFDPGLGGGSTVAIAGTIGACGDILGTQVKIFDLSTSTPVEIGLADSGLVSISTLGISNTTSGPPPGAHVSATPAMLAFSTVRVGTSPVLRTSIVSSGAAPVTLGGIRSTSPAFTVSPMGTQTVTTGTPLTLMVTFTPTAETPFSGSVTMTTNDTAHPTLDVAVSGTGGLPHLSLSPPGPTITIPPVPYCVGGSSVITVHNAGAVPLNVTGAAIGAPFSVTPANLTVAPSGDGMLTVHFAPSGVGPATGTLTFTSDDPALPATSLAVSATAVAAPPSISVSPASLAFDDVPVQFFVGLRVTVSNASPCEPLTVTLTTSGAPYFVTDADPTTLPPASTSVSGTVVASSSQRFVVVFAPQDTTAPTGTLTVTSNDPASGSIVVPLSGTGVTVSPASLELVLDRSGSMAAPAQGGTKMQGLIAAVTMFSELVITGRGDEMGSIQFDDAVAVLTPLSAYDGAQQAAIQHDASGLTPRNATSIGGGMEMATSRLGGSSLARKVMLVFTDGIENTPPTIASARAALPAGVEVYAIGLGQPTNISTDGLSAAAVTTGGRFFLSDDALILRKQFIQVLADAYRLDMAADPIVTIGPGARVELPVQITSCEQRISFVVNWDDPASDVDLVVIAPDGTRFDTSSPTANVLVRYVRRPRYRFCQVAFPPVDPGSGAPVIGPAQVGTWVMRLEAISLVGASERCTTSVLVESDLHIQSRVSEPDVASPFIVETRLTHQGAPITDAEVVVTLTMPTSSLALASTPTVVRRALDADLHPIRCGDRPVIPTTKKTYRSKVVDKATFELELPRPKVDGVYDVEVHAKGAACSGTFERYEAFSVYVRRRASPKKTTVSANPGKTANVAGVLLVPRDGKGVLLGPGLAGRIDVRLEGGSVSPVQDRLDGSYAVRVTWPPKLEKPVAIVCVDEVEVRLKLGGRRLAKAPRRARTREEKRPEEAREKPPRNVRGKAAKKKRR